MVDLKNSRCTLGLRCDEIKPEGPANSTGSKRTGYERATDSCIGGVFSG
jgi:hypothetical protein